MPKSIVSDFYYGIPAEIGLLSMKGIAKLIAEAPGITDCFVYASVRMDKKYDMLYFVQPISKSIITEWSKV